MGSGRTFAPNPAYINADKVGLHVKEAFAQILAKGPHSNQCMWYSLLPFLYRDRGRSFSCITQTPLPSLPPGFLSSYHSSISALTPQPLTLTPTWPLFSWRPVR